MSTQDNGGPALPVVELDRVTGGVCDQHFGMTMRDYFAAKAMQGMLAAAENYPTTELVSYAYEVAEAMLKARAQ